MTGNKNKTLKQKDKQDRYIATLLGCAIGDALDMPVEGMKHQQIRKYVGKIVEFIEPVVVKDQQGNELKADEFGKLKSYTRGFKKGEYTDDTILTLALAESLVVCNGFDIEDVAKRQVIEYTKSNLA